MKELKTLYRAPLESSAECRVNTQKVNLQGVLQGPIPYQGMIS